MKHDVFKNLFLAVASAVIVACMLVWLLNVIHIISPPMFPLVEKFNKQVPLPDITYAEFPFCLVYEINGKKNEIHDTIICEFDGVEDSGSNGKRRKWRTYLESGKERITLMDLSLRNEKNELGYDVLELFFSYGNGEYYMGDEYGSEPQINDYVEYLYSNNGVIGSSVLSADEAYEKYGIRLISWECASPIENDFQNK